MKVKKILNIILFVFIVTYIILGNNIVNAAGFDISATANDVKVGDKVTINVSFTAAAWNITVSGNGITGASYASQTDDLSEKTTTKTFALDTSKAGTYTITMSGDITDENGVVTKVNKSTTVKVTQPATTNNNSSTSTGTITNNNTQTQTPTETKKSSEARLSNLGINPKEYDFSGFKKDKTEYSVELPNSVTSVEVYATPADSKAKVSGTGTVTLNEGNNTVGITVTAEDGTTKKTYKLIIKRKTVAEETAENGGARLSSLGIKPEEYDFSGFTRDQKEYSVEVPNEVEEIEVYATAMDSKAQITGTGTVTLEEGKNELKIEVIAVNGTKETYTLKVTRKEAEVTEKFGLSTLSITGLTLTPNFKVGTYEYTVELKEDLSSLEIEAESNVEDAIVEIIGNENLQEGENTITILVTNKETNEVVTYQIVVNKNLAVEEVQTSWLKPSTWGKEEKIKIAIIVVLIILIISAIILKFKMKKENDPQNELEFPGADKLDKAISEHQEISEEIARAENINENNDENNKELDVTENIHEEEVQQNYIQDIAKEKFGIDEDVERKPRKKGRHF